MENLVIVDIGSNSVRMAIDQIDKNGHYREVKRTKNSTRLSEKMGPHRILQPTAMNRTIQALKSFKKYYQSLNNVTILGIATAAVRRAKNRDQFLRLVKAKIGIDLRVLSGSEEANYDYLGIADRVKYSNYVVMDIGGASIELVYVKRHRKEKLVSLPVGAVTLTEKFRLNDDISGVQLFDAQNYVHHQLQKVPWLSKVHQVPIILLGGAGRALVRMDYYKSHLNSTDNFYNYRLNRYQMFNLYDLLLNHNLASRKKIKGLENNRADVIIGGLLPLMILLNYFDSKVARFLDSGVREGIISQYIHQHYS